MRSALDVFGGNGEATGNAIRRGALIVTVREN